MRATELASGLDHSEGVCWDAGRRVLWAGGEAGQLYSVSLDGAVQEVARLPHFVLAPLENVRPPIRDSDDATRVHHGNHA